MTIAEAAQAALPDWLPEGVRLYLRHTECGLSLRALARSEGGHASTMLRRIRVFEDRRDDPLFDEGLDRLGQRVRYWAQTTPPRDETQPIRQGSDRQMSAPIRKTDLTIADEATVNREAKRILRRLCEPGAVLAVAPELDKAAVLKGTVRTAVVERLVAQAFALKDWIAVQTQGRITTYAITGTGRSALKRLLDDEVGARPQGLAEAPQPFAAQHRVWGERHVMEPGDESPRKQRYNLAESPLTVLARRRDKDGTPFLGPDLVAAGERLREDFEIAQMGPRIAQNWDRFLTGGDRGSMAPGTAGMSDAAGRARDRVAAALRDLGPGLGDMALRCCCFLEGLEAAERRMGWSARSGKIVLRIALIRLKRHYDEINGGKAPLVG